jgi:hypothetical protein
VSASSRRTASRLLLGATLCAAPAGLIAQAHPSTRSASVFAQAVPLVTRATGTANGRQLTEGYLAQPLLMGHAALGWARLNATLNLEGWTLERGEATTGAWGEGYVDRRHPHTYVHELMLGGVWPFAAEQTTLGASVFAGRGFVPFGSDDPMARPFVKYPTNHHLAQILERIVAIGAVRAGPAAVELATFNGDEPVDPSTPPRYSRFGDSWAVRATLYTDELIEASHGGEITASFAAVKSPEFRAGHGLDQRKAHVGARLARPVRDVPVYALVEWASTRELDRGRPFFTFRSVLAEAAVCPRGFMLAARVEQTERPEEERQLGDQFRSIRPATDLSIIGATRWTTISGALTIPAVRLRALRAAPFVEVAAVDVARAAHSLFDPTTSYGSPPLWMYSAGVRLQLGARHDRMGRYGAAAGGAIHSMPAVDATHAHGGSAYRLVDDSVPCPR